MIDTRELRIGNKIRDRMTTLEVTEEQLNLIQRALDFYSRVGIGQFGAIKNHPTFERHLANQFKTEGDRTDYEVYHRVRDSADDILFTARNVLYNSFEVGKNGSWGIHHPSVDNSCRVAFDILQVIRHEKWRASPDMNYMDLASSVIFTSDNPEESKKVKVILP